MRTWCISVCINSKGIDKERKLYYITICLKEVWVECPTQRQVKAGKYTIIHLLRWTCRVRRGKIAVAIAYYHSIVVSHQTACWGWENIHHHDNNRHCHIRLNRAITVNSAIRDQGFILFSGWLSRESSICLLAHVLTWLPNIKFLFWIWERYFFHTSSSRKLFIDLSRDWAASSYHRWRPVFWRPLCSGPSCSSDPLPHSRTPPPGSGRRSRAHLAAEHSEYLNDTQDGHTGIWIPQGLCFVVYLQKLKKFQVNKKKI